MPVEGEHVCVSRDDPFHGCATTSCFQCPSDEHTANLSCSADGQCVSICEDGFADCDSKPTTCETELATSPAHCGACGNVCESEHVDENGCDAGSCRIVRCEEGYFDQDEDPENGCESQDPCPLEPPSDLTACQAYNAVCAYEEEDVCASCRPVFWDVDELDDAECWDRPSLSPRADEPHPRYCAAAQEDTACCYTFNGEPRAFQICNGEYWVQQPMTYFDDHCP